jgi:hypothetical protein
MAESTRRRDAGGEGRKGVAMPHDRSMPSGHSKKSGRTVKEKRAAKQAKKGFTPKHRKRLSQAQ